MSTSNEPAIAPVPGLSATEQRQWEADGQLRVVTPPAARTRRPVTAFIHAALTMLPHRLRDARRWQSRPPVAAETARQGIDRAASFGEGHGARPER